MAARRLVGSYLELTCTTLFTEEHAQALSPLPLSSYILVLARPSRLQVIHSQWQIAFRTFYRTILELFCGEINPRRETPTVGVRQALELNEWL
jgi:hypothetical protein